MRCTDSGIIKRCGKIKRFNWNIPGIYFADDEALVYDVSAAYKPTPKGGWTVKRQKEEAAAAALAGNSVADSAEEVDE